MFISSKNFFFRVLIQEKELKVKLADLKFLLPRMKYSTHTPKARPFPENYFMQKNALKINKPNILEKLPSKDEYITRLDKPVSELSCAGINRKDGSSKILL